MRHIFYTVILSILLLAILAVVTTRLLPAAKLDLTAEKLYTVSQGTKMILHDLEEPVNLTLYYSTAIGQRVPAYGALAQRVQNLLDQYKNIAGRNLNLKVINPEPFSEEEDAALANGLKNAKLTADGDTLYFGLVGQNSIGEKNVFPFFNLDRANFLEYDLTKFIADLGRRGKPKIALLSTIDMTGSNTNPFLQAQQSNPWVIYTQMQEFFDVQNLTETTDIIPENIETLILVQPQTLPEKALYAIDQYLVKGGKAMIFVDPFFEGGPPSQNKREKAAVTFDDLLKKMGVRVTQEFVGDYNYARRVAVQEDTYQRQATYLAWPLFPQQAFNQNEAALAELQSVGMATVGAIIADDNTGIVPLITTTTQSGLLDAALLKPTPKPEKLLKAFQPTPESYDVAVRLSRTIDSSFKKGEKFVSQTDKVANIVIIADVDLLTNDMWVQVGNFLGQQMTIPIAGNGAFVLNTIESLTGNTALTKLRSRGVVSRPFTKIIALQKAAEDDFLAQEERITAALKKSQAQLESLLAGDVQDENGAAVLTPEQQSLIETQQQQVLEFRRNLRDVQRSLRQDVDNLRYRLILLNILLVPFLIALVAVWAIRRRWKLFY